MPSIVPNSAEGLAESLAKRASGADDHAGKLFDAVTAIASELPSRDITLIAITKRLNDDGHRSPTGQRLTPTTVGRALIRCGRSIQGIRNDRADIERQPIHDRLKAERLSDINALEAGLISDETAIKRRDNRYNLEMREDRAWDFADEMETHTWHDGEQINGVEYKARMKMIADNLKKATK